MRRSATGAPGRRGGGPAVVAQAAAMLVLGGAAFALAGCAADQEGSAAGDSTPPDDQVSVASSAAVDADTAATPGAAHSPDAQATGTPTATAAPPTPPPSPARPASAAGGACHLIDFPTLYEHFGFAFDVAAARSLDDAHACVLRATEAPLPDLALTVVPTSTDLEGFELDLAPEDSDEVERLGQIGYLAEVAPDEGRGPGLEVGWLSADGRLVTLALTLPADTDDPATYADALVEVARTVDRRRI